MPLLVNDEEVWIATGRTQWDTTAFSFEIAGPATAQLRLTERDQTDPAGRFRFLATGNELLVQAAASANWATATTLLTITATGLTTYPDDVPLRLGTGGDIALVNRSTILAANTALTNVLVGTPVTPAVAANSLIVSNITASGDILVATNNGGNSQAYLLIDSSVPSLGLYVAGVEELTFTTTTATIVDDYVFRLGTTGDGVLVNRSTILAADTALTNVLVGTPNSSASAANSLLISNITSDGDIAFFVVPAAGANSIEILRFDASAGIVLFNEVRANMDFQISTQSVVSAIHVDASSNAIGFGTGGTTSGFVTITPSDNTQNSNRNAVTINAHTHTITAGVTTIIPGISITAATITAATAQTVTNAASLYISAAPTAAGAGPATITNNYALWVDAGVSRFDDSILIGVLLPETGSTNTLVIANGTAPDNGITDAVIFYSSDISANNTEPSFFCEGTSVLATGQADSASSVRVRMRINGTEVVLLAI